MRFQIGESFGGAASVTGDDCPILSRFYKGLKTMSEIVSATAELGAPTGAGRVLGRFVLSLTVVFVIAMAAFLSAPRSVLAENPITGGPTQLLITYRCDPATRPAFRAYLRGDEAARLDTLKRGGVLKRYQILFNPFNQSGTWDAMAILSFTDYEQTQRWKEIERTAPGGLSAAGLRLAKPVDSYSADLSWDGAADDPGPSADRVFYVIPYDYVSADQYRKYVDGYVIPQVQGWMKEGVLSRYSIYMNRFGVGRPWDALFVYEYRDLKSFGRREEIVNTVRQPLKDDPAWRQLSDIKQTIRTESENTIADLIAGQ
jgi:hypothetical protein